MSPRAVATNVESADADAGLAEAAAAVPVVGAAVAVRRCRVCRRRVLAGLAAGRQQQTDGQRGHDGNAVPPLHVARDCRMTQVRSFCPGTAPSTDQFAVACGATGGTVTTLVAMTVSPGMVMKSTTIE